MLFRLLLILELNTKGPKIATSHISFRWVHHRQQRRSNSVSGPLDFLLCDYQKCPICKNTQDVTETFRHTYRDCGRKWGSVRLGAVRFGSVQLGSACSVNASIS